MVSNTSQAIRILLIHDTQSDAEPISNAVRNSGQAVRSHFIATISELEHVISNQSWDLMIVKLDATLLDPTEAVDIVHRNGRDISIIGLINEYNTDLIISAMDMGMADVVLEDAHEHLALVVKREYNGLTTRRTLRTQKVALSETERRCKLLLESSVDAIAYVHEGMHIFANSSYLTMFGYEDVEELQCTPIVDLVDKSEIDRLKNMLKNFTASNDSQIQLLGKHCDGETFKVDIAFSVANYDGEPCTQLVIRKAVDNAAEIEEQVKKAALLDSPTGLPNRLLFDQELENAFEQVVSQDQRKLIVHIGISNYNDIKKNLSLSDVDLVTLDIANLLKKQLKTDTQLLARYSDDMFVVLEQDESLDHVQKHWLAIQKNINEHLFDVNGRTIKVVTTLGFAHLDETSDSANEALVNASQAYNKAVKASELSQYYDKSDLENLADNSLVKRIQNALAHDGFKIQFQPIMSLRGDNKEHYEIQVRLGNGNDHYLYPDEFLPAIENSDLSGKVDRWVVEASAKSLSEHLKRGHDTQVMIHLTAVSIQDPTFLPWVNSLLKQYEVPGRAICFQITEKIAHNYLKAAKSFSKGLGILKCDLGISQFEQYHGDMSLTRHLDIRYIRVDSRFIERLANQEENADTELSEMLSLIHVNDINSIVPQIESADMMATLWEMGVNYIQGYFLQEPSDDMAYNFDSENEEAI